MKEKQGKRKSEENGNWAGGGAVSRGMDKGEEENRKRVIMLHSSLFPVSLEWALLIGYCRRRGTFTSWLVLLERDSCESEDPALIRIVWEQKKATMVTVERSTLNDVT